MTLNRVAAVVVLYCLGAGGAFAATAVGRITYISPDRHQVMLNNSDIYAVAHPADMSSVSVADWVKINSDRKDGENVITALVKAPLTLAASG